MHVMLLNIGLKIKCDEVFNCRDISRLALMCQYKNYSPFTFFPEQQLAM